MNDIVIPYLKNNSGELETCIKLIKKNFPHRNIHVIDKHDKSPYRYTAHVDQILKLKWAIENIDLTNEFYLFNDDFFIMKPIEDVPHYHRGTLTDHIASRPYNDWYTKSLAETKKILGDNALSYELHVPFKFNKIALHALIESFEAFDRQQIPHIRSAYGNLCIVEGEYMEDVKNIKDFDNSTYLSTTETSFQKQAIGEYIRSKV